MPRPGASGAPRSCLANVDCRALVGESPSTWEVVGCVLWLMRMGKTTLTPVEADLYATYGDDLVRFASTVAGPSAAQDVVSQAMAKLISNGALREAPNPRALMYRTVFNEAKSMQRSVFSRRRRERATARSVVAHDPEVRPDVVEAVLRLSPQQRACVWLTYWADLSVADTADHLGISEGTVKQHLSRARDRLKEVLDE